MTLKWFLLVFKFYFTIYYYIIFCSTDFTCAMFFYYLGLEIMGIVICGWQGYLEKKNVYDALFLRPNVMISTRLSFSVPLRTLPPSCHCYLQSTDWCPVCMCLRACACMCGPVCDRACACTWERSVCTRLLLYTTGHG